MSCVKLPENIDPHSQIVRHPVSMLDVYVRSLKLNGTSVFSASVWACPVESFSCLGQEGMGHYPWWV